MVVVEEKDLHKERAFVSPVQMGGGGRSCFLTTFFMEKRGKEKQLCSSKADRPRPRDQSDGGKVVDGGSFPRNLFLLRHSPMQ